MSTSKKLLNKRDVPILHVNRAKVVIGTMWSGTNRRGRGATCTFVNTRGFYSILGLELMRLMNRSVISPNWNRCQIPALLSDRDNMYKKLLVDERILIRNAGYYGLANWASTVHNTCFSAGTLPAKERELTALFAKRGVDLVFYGEYVRP